MADINQVITLGIGTPAGIPEFLTFGLQIGAAAVVPPVPLDRTFLISAEGRVFVIGTENRIYAIPEEDKTFLV